MKHRPIPKLPAKLLAPRDLARVIGGVTSGDTTKD
jgi:hypothetical protein